jgi:plasmid stabilization system protein ParE
LEVDTSRQAQLDALLILDEMSAVIAVERALEWFNGLHEAIYALAAFPNSHPIARDNPPGRQVRQALFGKGRNAYRILFVVRHETVWVLRIRHTAQKDLTPEEFGLPEDEETPC